MGRYYSGDIQGKFGFAIQPSSDFEFFGGQETNYINYILWDEDIPKAIRKTKTLIEKFKKSSSTKCNKLSIETSCEDFWEKYVDNNWYQNKTNGLLACRISMGLQIAQFNRDNPNCSIEINAEF